MLEATPWLMAALLGLLISLVMGLWRALRGPSLQDRMLSVQLLGSGGVGLLMLLYLLQDLPALLDVALVLALLAAVSAVAMTRRELHDD